MAVVFPWIKYTYAALPFCVILSMIFTRSQYRKVLPSGMWTPKRLYTLRLALLIQLTCAHTIIACALTNIDRITFLILDKDVFNIYTVIPGIMYAMVLLHFLYAL